MIERIVIVLLLFAFTNGHEIFLIGPRDEILGLQGEETRAILRYSWIALYVPLAGLIALRLRHVRASIGADPWLALLLLMCVLSAAWSVAAGDTLRRSFALLMTAGLGYYVAALHHPLSGLRMLAVALTLATLLGLAAGLLVPGIGIMTVAHPGAWRGVFVNKNSFGLIAALNAVILLVLWALDGAPRAWLALALTTSLTALLLSRSFAALVTTTATVTILAAVAILRRRPSAGSILMLAGLCVLAGLVLVSSVETVLAWSGRDPTLTGRTLIWEATWDLIQRRPILGYGYGAFWLESSEPASILQEAVQWATPSAHNGYLDLVLELGLVGLVVFGLSACVAIVSLLGRVRHREREILLPCSAAIAFVLLYNVAESAMLVQHHVLTFLYVWAAVMCSRDAGDRSAPGAGAEL